MTNVNRDENIQNQGAENQSAGDASQGAGDANRKVGDENPRADLVWKKAGELATNTWESQKKVVLESLAFGRSMKETAELAGLGRSTIYKWLKEDAEFRAAYNQWHNEVQHNMRSRVAAMADLAIEAVNGALAKGDGRLGMQYLKNMKAFDPAVVEKAANAGEARQEIELEEDRRRANQEIESLKIKTEKQKAENDLSITTPITDEVWEIFWEAEEGVRSPGGDSPRSIQGRQERQGVLDSPTILEVPGFRIARCGLQIYNHYECTNPLCYAPTPERVVPLRRLDTMAKSTPKNQ